MRFEEEDDLKAITEHIEELRKKIDWKSFRKSESFHALQKGRANYERLNDWNDLK